MPPSRHQRHGCSNDVTPDPASTGGCGAGGRWLGWFLVAISVALTVAFNPLGEAGHLAFVPGLVSRVPSDWIEVRALQMFEGRHQRVRLYELRFQFRTPAGHPHVGVSYVSDRELERANRSTVEYLTGVPQLARLQGHRLTVMGLPGLLLLAPGLVGAQLLRARRRTSTGASEITGLHQPVGRP